MLEEAVSGPTMVSESAPHSEADMVREERWEEIRRLYFQERHGVSKIARLLELDRKTVRRCLRQSAWQPYRREAAGDTLLTAHADFLRERAPAVHYSARILYQELRRDRGYGGSYETVKRFVAPLRELESLAALTQTRFETEPGHQSQIDWGESLIDFRSARRKIHFFVLTLGFSRRAFCSASADQRLAQLLEAHECAFEHFGGHTQEHLYDRPRTVCAPMEDGRVVWNPTFKAFADYWHFEPRLCRPYRAQTKGKVESGVKYLKRNFLPGRRFLDIEDLSAQLAEWTATIADQRVHGTTHEVPLARFERERPALIPTSSQPSFALGARFSRIVAEDYLVSFHSHRYSVPFPLIGQTVEVQREDGGLSFYHRDRLVARHALGAGSAQMHILPEHGPGAIARKARQHFATAGGATPTPLHPDVEVRDLSLYEQLAAVPA